jgi:hypothetical protein
VPTVYKFQVSMPVTDTLPRNRFVNAFHLQHVIGSLADTDLKAMCDDIVEMWQAHYGNLTHEVQCKAYDTDAVPNYPRATSVVNVGSAWPHSQPREVALCLSYSGVNSGNKSERGRMYLGPGLAASVGSFAARPTAPQMQWAMDFYETANSSLPDLGGVDWQFGVWSPTYKKFTVTKKAWVNDEWDTIRARGLRESGRLAISRDG